MHRNVGLIDRTVRIAIGVVALAFALDGNVWAWLGVLPLATGIFSICPLYSLIHVTTQHEKPA